MPFLILVLPLLLWGALRLSLAPGPYNMDQGNLRGSFFPLMILYSVWQYAIVILSAVGAFLCCANSLPWPAALLVSAGLEALLFNGLLVLLYELYMHSTAAGRSNYTINRYAAVISLGVSSFVTFVVGIGMMAVGLMGVR